MTDHARIASAVIGSAYGDEGKGLTVDVLASATEKAVVVRTNGGAQAGHTVVTPDGRRHVFHHIGSGAFADKPTHWSARAVAHPMMLLPEIDAVRALGGNVDITCDPRAPITTPFDVLINQAVEIARGTARHGSCGMGFGETIERNLRPEFATTAATLLRPDLRARLSAIRDLWVPARLEKLGVRDLDPGIAAVLGHDALIDRFLDDCEDFLEAARLLPDRRILEVGRVIFEGAQGLQLDQDYGAFPHVTRSNTGLLNMVAVAEEAGIEAIEAIYATRVYTTRHGAGPLPREREALEHFTVVDPTNAPNEWQGTIRYADLDLDHLGAAIRFDIGRVAERPVRIEPKVLISCLDQANGAIPVFAAGERMTVARENAGRYLAEILGLPLLGESWGPTRGDFRPHLKTSLVPRRDARNLRPRSIG